MDAEGIYRKSGATSDIALVRQQNTTSGLLTNIDVLAITCAIKQHFHSSEDLAISNSIYEALISMFSK